MKESVLLSWESAPWVGERGSRDVTSPGSWSPLFPLWACLPSSLQLKQTNKARTPAASLQRQSQTSH